MARRTLAPAAAQFASKSKKRRARKRREAARRAAQPKPADWNEVELAFFAAAPPDEPEPAPTPESFDDLAPAPAAPPSALGWFRGLVALARSLLRSRGAESQS